MKNCLVLNLDRCTGCDSCVAACKFENNLGLGVNWNRVVPVGPVGTHPDLEMYWIPGQCQQCESAACISVCPTGASYRDAETGVVLINKESCIGCHYCAYACPYGVRAYNEKEHVMEKCTLCNHLTADGTMPACVVCCTTGARFYGDLDDPSSEASRELAKYPAEAVHALSDAAGTHPATRYILSPGIAKWQEL
jgi:Fe-S-cluster-containing dehydrogenase component